MSIKGLIKNQTIIIDDHKRGSQEIKNWDDKTNDIHIDKTTNFKIEGIRQKLRIRIPINSERPIKIENARKESLDKIPRQLDKEIKKALENEQKRVEFVSAVIEILKNFETSLSSEDKAKQILNNLSAHFELQWTGEKIASYTKNILLAYTQVYNDIDDGEYFMKIDIEKIEIGQNSGYAKQFKKINRN